MGNIQHGESKIINLFTLPRVQPPYIAIFGSTPHLPVDAEIIYQVIITGDNFPAKPYTILFDPITQQFKIR